MQVYHIIFYKTVFISFKPEKAHLDVLCFLFFFFFFSLEFNYVLWQEVYLLYNATFVTDRGELADWLIEIFNRTTEKYFLYDMNFQPYFEGKKRHTFRWVMTNMNQGKVLVYPNVPCIFMFLYFCVWCLPPLLNLNLFYLLEGKKPMFHGQSDICNETVL